MAIYFDKGTSPGAYWNAPLAEGWRVTSAFQGDAQPITNWEKQDDVHGSGTNGGPILTESSGIFTFAELGYYLITWTHYAYIANTDVRYAEMYLGVSWNSGSNWDYHGFGAAHIANDSSSNVLQGQSCSSIVTGTQNTRLRWRISSANSNLYTGGSTNEQVTGFTVVIVGGL